MKSEILERYNKLYNPPPFANANWYRSRGRKFESILNDLLECEKLSPKIRLRPSGEEIDGSFILGNKVYLIEAKWHKDGMPASSIYEFKGKVDGKLIGTIGIFISISGYSEQAVDSLVKGKTINIILFNREDFEDCLAEDSTFSKVLLTKLRYAAEEGVVFFPYRSSLIKSTVRIAPEISSLNISTSNVITENVISQLNKDIIIICEGNIDKEIILRLSRKILERFKIERSINILAAMGKITIPKIIKSVQQLKNNESKIVLIADGDNEIEKSILLLTKDTSISESNIVLPNPSIEIWFNNVNLKTSKDIYIDSKKRGISFEKYLDELIEQINVEQLMGTNSSFRQLIELIID